MNLQEYQKLETKILQILQKHLQTGDTVVAGISGGPDSVFLLHLLKKLPIKIIVAHVNHQLRKESNADESFVAKLCTHNVHTHFPTTQTTASIFAPLTANIKSLSQKSRHGEEETGRKIRYDFFKKLAKKHKAKFILTAHHADDNLETVIMNFARGASLQGLSGMQEIEKFTTNTTSLLRPLLNISKKQILSYLKFKKIPFRVDKSNNSTIYNRNFIRHKIIPQLQKLNPNISETIAKNSQNLREINELLKSQASDWIQKNSLNKGKTHFNAKNFRTQSLPLQKLILLKIYETKFKTTQNLESKHLDEIILLIQKNIGNKKKRFGKITISVKNNIITLL